MNEVVRLTKKTFTWGVVATTIMWSVGVAALPLSARALSLASGSLIKGSLPAVYYYASDGKRYVFPNQKTYNTWRSDFSGVQVISDADLATISIGGNVTYRSGTRLVKIQSDPKTYAVEPGGKLRWVNSESVASTLWGSMWNKRIDDVSDAFFTNYTSASDLSTNVYPKGSLVKTAASADVWYIDGTSKRKVLAAGMTANKFMDAFVVTVATSMESWLSGLTMGTDISAGEPTLTDVAQIATGPAPVSGGTGLTMALASDNPAGATIVADSGGDGSDQAMIGMLKIHFTASSDGAVQVNTIKVTRGGISADADIQDAYLMDGDSLSKVLARSGSISSGKISFSNSAGLFSVPAGGSKDVYVRFDISKSVTTAGKTYSFSVAAADVTAATTGTTVSGTANGNTFTLAIVADLGRLELKSITPSAAVTINPQNGQELWRFSAKAVDEAILIKSLTITNAGSVNASDIQNYKLMDGTTQLGSTVSTVSGNTITFDLTSMTGGGYSIPSGQTKQLSLYGDIIGGTNRTYRYGIRNATDALSWDKTYNVYVRPVRNDSGYSDGGASFAVVEPNSSGTAVDATISTGKLTIQKASDSPSTNVPSSGTGVTLAKWNFTASGEDVKINSMSVKCASGDGTTKLKNNKLVYDGSQVGTTVTTATVCDNSTTMDYTFGNSFIVPAGSTKTLVYSADLTDSTVAAGDTITPALVVGSSNAEGRVSLTSISTSASSANTVTVKSGAVVTTKDASFTDRSATTPTGVLGATGVNIGQFVVTGGGEDSDVTQIVLKDDVSGSNMNPTFQNLKLWVQDLTGGTWTQVGQTVATLTATAATTYTMTPTSAIRVVAGGSRVFKVTADIKTGGTVLTADGVIYPSQVSATGVVTGTSTSDSDGTNAELQFVYITTNGNLSIYPDSSTPVRATRVLASTDIELFRFDLAASVDEDINVTKIAISDVLTFNGAVAATGTLKNLRLLDATSGVQYGGAVASLDSSTGGSTFAPVAVFDNISTLKVPRNGNKVIKMVSDFTSYTDGGVSSSSHKMTIFPCYVCATAVNDSSSTSASALSITATGQDSGFSITGTWLDFNTSSVNSNTDTWTGLQGNTQDAFRTKITIAKASDSPSGLSSGSSEQTVAKFVVTNSANVGNYTATLRLMDLNIGSTISPGGTSHSNRAIKVYKDSVTGANQLVTTNADPGTATFSSTAFEAAGGTFTDTDIAAGQSRTYVVTIDTSDASNQKTLTVGLATSGLLWSDGVTGTTGTTAITVVDSLPVPGNTLTY